MTNMTLPCCFHLSHGDDLKCWGWDDWSSSLSLFPGPTVQSTFSVWQTYSQITTTVEQACHWLVS